MIEQSLTDALAFASSLLAYSALPIILGACVFVASLFALGKTHGALILSVIAGIAVYGLVADVQGRGISLATLAVAALIVVVGFVLWRVNMLSRGGK